MTVSREAPSMLWCLVDEAGSLSRATKEPFRVGFLMTCRPQRLDADLRRLKVEVPPRGKHGEYHSREDDSGARAMLRSLLCLNREPLMYIVEWKKDQFSDASFVNNKLRIFGDSNPFIASFAITASDIAMVASSRGFSGVHVVAEAAQSDRPSDHRSRKQALNRVLPLMFEKQAGIARPPPGTKTALQVSTLRKSECPSLSFVDYWLWAYSRHTDQGDPEVLPTELKARTSVTVMTEAAIRGSAEAIDPCAI